MAAGNCLAELFKVLQLALPVRLFWCKGNGCISSLSRLNLVDLELFSLAASSCLRLWRSVMLPSLVMAPRRMSASRCSRELVTKGMQTHMSHDVACQSVLASSSDALQAHEVNATFQCAECRQKFDSEKAGKTHIQTPSDTIHHG